MKLNNQKNIKLCLKALYAEQLKSYASLCECYEALANNLGDRATSEDVQRRYATYLSLASKGDLSFTSKEKNFIFSQSYQGPRFHQSEIKIFERYAKESERLRTFKKGAEILSEEVDVDEIYKSQINKFSSYMKKASPETRKFDREVSEHSPTYIGHRYYLTSRNAIRSIQNIDPSHLQGLSVPLTIAPSQFGANISGYTKMEHLLAETKEDARFMDTKEERASYAQRPNTLSEMGYRFFAKNQRGVALSLSAILALGLAAGVATEAKKSIDYSSLNLENLAEKGYDTDLSAETLSTIEELGQAIEDARSQGTIPSSSQLNDIGQTIDGLFDTILAEKLTPAFLESHPDAKDVVVNHSYNYYDQENPQNIITISYTDRDGQTHEENIKHFSSVGLFSPNDVSNVFDHEYNTDASYKAIDSIFSGGKDYTANGKSVTELLDQYSNSFDFINHLAAVKLEYSEGNLLGIFPSSKITSTMPDRTSESNPTSSRSIDDDDAR